MTEVSAQRTLTEQTKLLRQGAECGDAGAQQGGLVVLGKNLQREALQRAHFDHGFDERAQGGELEEADVVAGEIETARPGEVNERGCSGGEGAVPQLDEFAA